MSIAITFLITIQAVTHVQDERSRADVNQDGIINILDLVIVAKYLSKQEEMKPVLTLEPVPEQPIPETEAPEPVSPEEITFANALELQIGETYRMRPSSYDTRDDRFGDKNIRAIYWGTVDNHGRLQNGVSPDDPKMRSKFFLKKEPYSQTLDEKNVIDWVEQTDGTRIYDEILIKITDQLVLPRTGEKLGGSRGNRFTYKFANYGAVLIENLTHPDRKFEYE